jgi:hypothetical protein
MNALNDVGSGRSPTSKYVGSFVVASGISTLFPSLVVWYLGNGRENFFNEPFPPGKLTADDLFMTLFYACIAVTPGSIVLSLVLVKYLLKSKTRDLRGLVVSGARMGALTSFLNLPAYFVVSLLYGSPLILAAQLIALFLLTGAACGGVLGLGVHASREG